ncbi:MAG: GNAT family N-acetyltransferase [Gammaproteobacteria bacterium]|nr:MAG: GNAT family N-acetyltransferase [Gammaproteobacteria bacterium]RLA53014.1 MAG: GNAT family N-acetyltransferase [Gammaproteobacteria bacterium]
MNIQYTINEPVSPSQFMALLHQSTLAERRPIEDPQCITGMINNSNLVIAAWHDAQLVGIARSVTDFHYACYLSDLAVDTHYQRCGIGKQLQIRTQQALGPKCKLILIAAPAAHAYYEHIGFTQNNRCWVLEPEQQIT